MPDTLSKLNSVDFPKPPSSKKGWPWTEETDLAIYNLDIVYPKISIVTPSFNQGEFIEETIRSILLQNYPNLEYIIVDGGSTDKTLEIIKKYENYISYWISESDNGQSEAINKGFAKSSGAIMNWLNSDDYYYSGTLKKVASYFSEHPNISVVCGKSRAFDDRGKEFILAGTYIDSNSLQRTLCKTHIEQPATFFKSSACRVMGPLSQQLHFVMDKEWWIKYLLNFSVSNVIKTEEKFVNFRLHNNSKTVSVNSKFNDEYATILRSLALQKDLKCYAVLLEMKYAINKDYRFTDPSLMEIDKSDIEMMILHFILKYAHHIYSKSDFIHSKEVLLKLDFKSFKLNTEESEWLRKLKKNANGNWFLFRIKRKIKWILNAKK